MGGTMKMETKYIFLDVDGTLVNFRGEIPDSAVYAIKKAQANGHKIMLATGRQKSQIHKFLFEKIDFDGMVASSGAYIEYDGKVIFESRPSREKLCQMIDFFDKYKIPYFLQSTDKLIALRWCYDQIYAHFESEGAGKATLDSVFGNTEVVEDPRMLECVEKAAYYYSPLSIDEVRAELGDYYYIVSYSLGRGQSLYHGEITFDGVNKANGIERFMEMAGAPMENSIAFGDSGNDLDMIKTAGIGVCMGNGSEDVKAVADIVTTDVTDDGIYNAFVKLGLI